MNKLFFTIAFFTCSSVFLLRAQTQDFTPTLEIDGVTFLLGSGPRDFAINVSEINNGTSTGQLVVKIPKLTAFIITFDPTATMININGGATVSNSNWTKTENAQFITLTSNVGVVFNPYSIATIGLTIVRKPNIMGQTNQSLTVTIVDGSGGDTFGLNNIYNIVVRAY